MYAYTRVEYDLGPKSLTVLASLRAKPMVCVGLLPELPLFPLDAMDQPCQRRCVQLERVHHADLHRPEKKFELVEASRADHCRVCVLIFCRHR